MTSPKIAALTNIPTPYRVHFYNKLARELAHQGWDLELFFMAMSESHRYWRLDSNNWSFASYIDTGVPTYVGKQPVYLNPRLIYRLLRSDPKYLLVSGGWFHPTTQIVTWLSHLSNSTRTYFWSESNLHWGHHQAGLIRKWRRITYSAFDGYVIPGQFAKEYLLHHYPEARRKEIVYLPNLVDERLYRDRVDKLRQNRVALRHRFGIPEGKRVLLMVARLAPIKGVVELLRALAELSGRERQHMTLLIAGEGEQRSEIETLIRKQDLIDVYLLGHRDDEDMVASYAVANAFILPSLGDPYPLAVIEAAFAGLPLLLSLNVGCHPEILESGRNGWLFDSRDTSDVRRVLTEFIQTESGELKQMGQHSRQIANERFRTDRVIPRFVAELTT